MGSHPDIGELGRDSPGNRERRTELHTSKAIPARNLLRCSGAGTCRRSPLEYGSRTHGQNSADPDLLGQPTVVGHEQQRPVVSIEGQFELFDGGQVQMVGWLV